MKDIPGFECLYAITKNGRVWSYRRQGSTGRFVKIYTTSDSRHHINLWKKNVCYKFLVHRLVALTYIQNIQNKKEVNHINGIKTDNRVENLEWCTMQENRTHAAINGLMAWGERSKTSKLKEFQIREIRTKYKTDKVTQDKLGRDYGVNSTTIHKIVHNLRWRHLK